MKMLDYSKGAVPLYMQISQDLKEKIMSGAYKYGQNIPTELELQELYSVSRITVRQALQSLEQEGLVVRARGKGTMVSGREKIEEQLTCIRSFTEEMRERNMIPGTKLAEVDKIKADERLADIFSCGINETLYHIRRVRTADGKAMVLFDSYIFSRKELPLESERYNGSLYQLLEEQGIERPVGVEERFEAIAADEETGRALDIEPGAPIMKRTRFSFNKDLQVQEYTVSYYNGADYAYVVYAGVTDRTDS